MALYPLQDLMRRHDRAIRQLCRIGFAVSIVVVCVLSLLPADALPKVRIWDKIGHMIAYTEITAIGLLGYWGRNAALWIVAGVVALGATLEIAQHFIPGRSMDLADFAVNGLGVLLGYLFACVVRRYWPATSERPGA